MDAYLFLAVVGLLLLLVGAVIIHVMEWRLYVITRQERDMARETLVAMTKDRDGWRGVAERSLLAAQLSLGVGRRAARAASVQAQIDDSA